jgi:4,5-dihydroxyphthalate decarboxylase
MLKLTIGFAPNPRIDPLLDGTIKTPNLDLRFVLSPPPELFYRNLKYNEFDVFEMSLSEFVMLNTTPELSEWEWIGLPIFPRKAFIWLNLFVNAQAGIKTLADLKNKRVGVPDYPITASVWMRIILNELYRIKPSDITWYNGRTKDVSHGWILGLGKNPPAGISVNWLTEEQTLDTMLHKGDLDAAYGFLPPPAFAETSSVTKIDRYGGTPITGNPKIRRLFSDGGREIMIDYYRKTRFLPVNHLVVVQKRILDQDPWVALEIYKAFEQAKKISYERAKRLAFTYMLFEGEDFKSQALLFGEDPYPYGIEKNKEMLDVLFQWAFDEGLAKKRAQIEEIFYRTTLGT